MPWFPACSDVLLSVSHQLLLFSACLAVLMDMRFVPEVPAVGCFCAPVCFAILLGVCFVGALPPWLPAFTILAASFLHLSASANFASSLPLSSASLPMFHHHHCHRCPPSQKHPPVVVPPGHHHWILSLFVSPLPGISSSHTCQKFFPIHQYGRTQAPS